MIGQVTIGKSFGGIVRYVMEKDRAEMLDTWGIRSFNSILATQDFNNVRIQNPKVKNAVWHASLSFAYDDKLTRDQMIAIGKDYLEKIGLYDHQYLMVRHHDTRHEHIHIVANRVGYKGKVVSDQWCRNRTAHVCDLLEEKYGLTIARKQGRRSSIINDKVPDKKWIKQKIRLSLSSCIEHGISDFNKLKEALKEEGIDVLFHTQSTGRINGISFRYKNFTFKGSSIDKSFSFRRLARRLSQNGSYDKDRDQEQRRKY